VLPDHVRPFDLDIALPPVQTEPWKGHDKTYTQLVFGDMHVPYMCEQSVAIMLQIIEDHQPQSIINLGDQQDAYALSDFMKDPNRKETFEDEINITRVFLKKLRLAAPTADIQQFEGNHEERLRRTLWRAAKTSQVLFNLTSVRRELTWPVLLDLEGLAIKWHPTGTIAEIAPGFYGHHGDVKGDPFLKFGVSGISGHIHKFDMRTRRSVVEQLEWFTCPTMGTLNPEYDCHPSWQNGFWFFTHDLEEGTRYAEPVRIQDGKALFRGRKYSA